MDLRTRDPAIAGRVTHVVVGVDNVGSSDSASVVRQRGMVVAAFMQRVGAVVERFGMIRPHRKGGP